MWKALLPFLAVLMMGAASAPAPDNGADAEQREATTNIQRSLAEIASAQAKAVEQAKAGEYEAPCAEGEYNNQSDLCAQWYAASAARDAADSAWWAVFWTVISLGLSLGGLIALIITIRQGREGLDKAEGANKLAREEFEAARRDADESAKVTSEALATAQRNANSAERQVEISEKMAQRELRAYVLLEVSMVEIGKDGVATITLHFSNAGKTPAQELIIDGKLGSVPRGHPPRPTMGTAAFDGTESRFSLAPGGGRLKAMRLPDKESTDAVRQGDTDLYVWGEARYKDVFGKPHWSRFRLFAGGDYGLVHGMGIPAAAEGNEEDPYD